MQNCKFCDSLFEGKSWQLYCNVGCRKKWNQKNISKSKKAEMYQKQKRQGFENKLKGIAYKGGKCIVCAEARPAVLCFHHKKPEDKIFELSARTFSIFKWESVVSELDKCDLLCHNCHHIVHNGKIWDEHMVSS